ncbi:aminomethyltransferase, mitochondrial [Caerostris darwini]|uniref:Aminomethyltransferase n=1 Tax=Caerostris darwini TaxID=1538125 RepID=A0AAV4WR49_9ARAC|nr:aminomethyltransferase, mitochondrial [Caerostris darwini]
MNSGFTYGFLRFSRLSQAKGIKSLFSKVTISSLNGIQCSKNISSSSAVKKLDLHEFHEDRGAKFTEFGGYLMPISYKDQSIVESHLFTRSHASIFDVSHMLQTYIKGKNCAKFIEELVVSDIENLNVNQSTLTLMTNDRGGIIDDMIVTKAAQDELFIVSNAGHADKVFNRLQTHLSEFNSRGNELLLETPEGQGLFAFQGPKSVEAVKLHADYDVNLIPFMGSLPLSIMGKSARISRCGYTGEDGFEISLKSSDAKLFLPEILSSFPEDLKLAGLGARDTLRLEASLCLAGSDFNEDRTPVQAGLGWTISKRRRKEGGFPGADIILKEFEQKPKEKRVGISSKGPCPRGGAQIMNKDGKVIGAVTSGCFSPCLQMNVSMGYVLTPCAKIGTELNFKIHNRDVKGSVTKMPFVPTKYHTG